MAATGEDRMHWGEKEEREIQVCGFLFSSHFPFFLFSFFYLLSVFFFFNVCCCRFRLCLTGLNKETSDRVRGRRRKGRREKGGVWQLGGLGMWVPFSFIHFFFLSFIYYHYYYHFGRWLQHGVLGLDFGYWQPWVWWILVREEGMELS